MGENSASRGRVIAGVYDKEHISIGELAPVVVDYAFIVGRKHYTQGRLDEILNAGDDCACRDARPIGVSTKRRAFLTGNAVEV